MHVGVCVDGWTDALSPHRGVREARVNHPHPRESIRRVSHRRGRQIAPAVEDHHGVLRRSCGGPGSTLRGQGRPVT